MLKVLIVHDRAEVGQKIANIVRTTVPSAEFQMAEDGAGARRFLSQSIFDLLVLDLTLPHMRGARADYRVADELMKEMFGLDTLNVPGDIIGMTKDTEALELVSTSLGPHLMVTILEDAEAKWETYLADKIRYAERAATTRQVSANRHYVYDALLITALDEEFEPYRSRFDLTELRHFPGASEFVFADRNGVSRRGVAYAIGKAGQARAASSTQSLLSFFRPKLALMSGFCGGVKGKSNLGDLMLFESSYDWDYGKWVERPNQPMMFLSRPSPISIEGAPLHRIARALIESNFSKGPALLRDIKQKSLGAVHNFTSRLCPAASGSAVVANDEIIERIGGLNESIRAVDMESYGFYFACSRTMVAQPDFICIKSVADFCNGDKGDELHEACSAISAAATIEILTHYWDY